jgi:peptidoglycan-N-acetylglucosamine deacetylase
MAFWFSTLLCLLFPLFYRAYSQLHIKRICIQKGYVVLTYDDGPSMETTPELLDLLEQTQTKATFFVLGSKIANNIKIIQKMVDLGHEIGCHGYDHLNAWKIPPWTEIENLKQGFVAMSKARINCTIFRPPYGKITIFSLGFLFMKNIKSIWWTMVSGDTYSTLPDPVAFVEKVLSEGGGVVLMHDFHTSKLRKEFVIKVTSLIIEKSKQKGLLLKTIGEVF